MVTWTATGTSGTALAHDAYDAADATARWLSGAARLVALGAVALQLVGRCRRAG